MPRLRESLTDDFSNGMYDSVAPTRFPRASARAIYNARIQPDGSAKRRSGTKRTSAAAPNSGIGYYGGHFTTAGGVDQIIAISGTVANISTDGGVTWTEKATGLASEYYTEATMRVGAVNYRFLANGATNVQRYDGSTWDTLANVPSGVKLLAHFNGRLWVAGHSGVLLQASKIADPTTWSSPDGLTVQVDEPPTALFNVGPHLLVFDKNSTSYVDGYGEQTLIVGTSEQGFSESVGCVAARSVVAVGDQAVCWLSYRGIEYYSPQTGIVLISRAVQEFLSGIDFDDLYDYPNRITAEYDAVDQNLLMALSTDGTRNNRILVLNLRTNVDDQRKGKRAAATIDRLQSPDSGDLLFGGDDHGYLTVIDGGAELKTDSDGYSTFAGVSETGDPISEDSDGYLSTVTNDTLPATLFVAPVTGQPNALYSIGYDGFVRSHYGHDKDDLLSDGSGGTDVAMTIRGKPSLFGDARRKKRSRVIHVASIQDSDVTVTVSVHGAGKSTLGQDLTMKTLGADSAYRNKAMVKLDADAPSVQVVTTDDCRITLLGLSAQLLKERV